MSAVLKDWNVIRLKFYSSYARRNINKIISREADIIRKQGKCARTDQVRSAFRLNG
jgi:hypothetical protein